MQADHFSTFSLRQHPEGQKIQRVLAASLNAVDAESLVRRNMRLDRHKLQIGKRTYDLSKTRRIILLGIGKASIPMSRAAIEILGDQVSDGLIVCKHAPVDFTAQLPVIEAGHPIPDGRSLEAGRRIKKLVTGLGENDLVVVLISGGGSALVTLPETGVQLDDLQSLTHDLLICGARIDEINTLRRRLDQLKGGGLAQAASPARVISLILSDVVGDRLESIASGLTYIAPAVRADPLELLDKFNLLKRTAPGIIQTLKMNKDININERSLIRKRVFNLLVGNNRMAVQAAVSQARLEGFDTQEIKTDLQGEARRVGFEMADQLQQVGWDDRTSPRPCCLVAGGETTVTVTGDGKGGRNQELALASVETLAGLSGVMLISLATDGEDGNSDAAGAVVTGETLGRAARLGMEPDVYLARNDSYSFFERLDDLIKIEPTATQVNDLVLLFKGK